MAISAQTSPLERQRMAALRSSRSPLPEMPATSRQPRPSAGSGPVFGEEGFGDLEAARAARPRQTDEEATEDDQEQERPAIDDVQRIRAQAQEDQQQQEAEATQEQGGLSSTDQLARDQIDTLMNAVCYLIPVVLHFLWWNVRMVYGSWIADGKSRYIGPFGWSDVAMVLLPGGKSMGAATAGKAVAQILPDFVAHLTLLFIDLWIMTAMAMMLVLQFVMFYLLYLVVTDPIGSLTQFGSLISSLI